MPNFSLFGPRVWPSCLNTCTYIQRYIHSYIGTKIYNKWVHGSNSLGPSVIQKFYFGFFFFLALHTNGKKCGQVGPHSFFCSKDLSGHSTIFWHDMNTERGVAICIYLKHSPDDYDFKYIGAIGLTP